MYSNISKHDLSLCSYSQWIRIKAGAKSGVVCSYCLVQCDIGQKEDKTILHGNNMAQLRLGNATNFCIEVRVHGSCNCLFIWVWQYYGRVFSSRTIY